jgi:hypothetical protein
VDTHITFGLNEHAKKKRKKKKEINIYLSIVNVSFACEAPIRKQA